MFKGPIFAITLPGVVNKLMMPVIIMINNKGFRDLITLLIGIFATLSIAISKATKGMKVIKSSTKNMVIINRKTPIIFTLGSSL